MVISTHPDDEGIFFAGLLPYYSQVADVPIVHISMTSGDAHGLDPSVRESQLLCADWNYGLRNPPLFPRFKDRSAEEGLTSLAAVWDLWADGVIDGQGIDTGELITASYIAEQFRRYRPEVVTTQDFDGETGHYQHRATAIVVADAYDLAADPAVELAGLPPWQVKKLYHHQYHDRTPSRPMINHLQADWDVPYPELGGLTPMQVCDAALCCHVYAGGCRIPEIYAQYRWCSPCWGLYRSTVGPDTVGPDGWAHDDFLEHLPDCNGDGVLDVIEMLTCAPSDPSCRDCNNNGVPDGCDLSSAYSTDCNHNSVPDECEIASGTSADCNGDGIPDECQTLNSRDLSQPQFAYCGGLPKPVYVSIITPPGATAIALEDQPPEGWTVSDISNDGVWDEVQHKVKWGPFFGPFPSAVSYTVTPPPDEEGPRCFAGRISIDGPYTELCGDTCIIDLCCPHIPADEAQAACPGCGDCTCATCGDGRVELCEMVAYACAWRRGCVNNLAAMTRAGYIWQNAEYYCWYSDAQNWFATSYPATPPGCCTGREAEPELLGTGEANRELPASITPGTWFQVNISLTPPPDVSAVAMEDQPPAGWQVRALSGDGAWDAVHGKVKWGPYFEPNIPTSFSYQMLPPGEAAGEYCFDGAVSFDGLNQPLASDACVSTWTLGDANCDGAVNAFDIDPFVLALTSQDSYDAAFPNCSRMLADTNCDGIVNTFDIDPFVLCLTSGGCAPCP
jgi:LmbE family N-acetylglucosaminyl deacetylase